MRYPVVVEDGYPIKFAEAPASVSGTPDPSGDECYLRPQGSTRPTFSPPLADKDTRYSAAECEP
jgi:hypothetical protein